MAPPEPSLERVEAPEPERDAGEEAQEENAVDRAEAGDALADDAGIADEARDRAEAAGGLFNRGRALFDDGEFERAIAYFDEAISLSPDFAAAYLNRGLAFLWASEFELAVRDFSRALSFGPCFYAHFNRGLAFLALHDGYWMAALDDLTHSIRLNDAFLDAYIHRGILFWGIGRSAEAIADFEAALRVDPDDSWAADWLEYARRHAGD